MFTPDQIVRVPVTPTLPAEVETKISEYLRAGGVLPGTVLKDRPWTEQEIAQGRYIGNYRPELADTIIKVLRTWGSGWDVRTEPSCQMDGTVSLSARPLKTG